MESKRHESESSDDLDDEEGEGFEESPDPRRKQGGRSNNHDSALDMSGELSLNESYDGRANKNQKMHNDKYDEALELSQSIEPVRAPPSNKQKDPIKTARESDPILGKSQSISNRHFDEALEMSHSNSDDSGVQTPTKSQHESKAAELEPRKKLQPNSLSEKSEHSKAPSHTIASLPKSTTNPKPKKSDEDSSDEDGDDEKEDSAYDMIEGQYNPEDFAHLSVSAEVRDLFQYITRYKAQDVELDTALRCFVPDYIPAIGDMDTFLKVPRPDGLPDLLGLKTLDEPSSSQSDPTVLELQLRAVSKKQQYGDVVVRSIENASKSPAAIDKWIGSISELHRSKPPPQVHYKRNMPDPETLMEMWPAEFEEILRNVSLPSPDLDLSLQEYAKVLCAILDIPTYENPIESLHLMFSLYMDFRNNPHFQAPNNATYDPTGGGYGDADVMHIDQGGYK